MLQSSAITGRSTAAVIELGWRAVAIRSIQVKTFLGVAVEPSPKEFVGDHDKNTHYRNAANDHGRIAFLSHLGYVSAEAVRLQRRRSPRSEFCNDARVPGPPGGGACASHPEGKDRRQDQGPPERPPAQTVRLSRLFNVVR